MPNHLDRLEEARELMDGGRFAGAEGLLRGSWPPVLAPEAALLRGDAQRQQGFFLEAMRSYQDVLKRPSAQDPALWAQAALGQASVLRSLGRGGEARNWASRGLALARRRGLRDLAEELRLELLLIERAEEKYAKVIPAFHARAAKAKAARDHAKEAFLLWAAGGAERFDGRLAQAQRTFERSLSAARRAQDGAGQAYALFGLGGISRIRGLLSDSERFYREAGRRLKATEDVFGKAYAECGLANALRQRGRLKEALSHYNRAHKLYSSLGDRLDLAYVDWGLGKIALQEGRLPEAARRLSLALAAFEKGGETRGVVLSRIALASARHAQGRTAEAERLFDAAYRLARKARIHAHLETYT